MKSPDSTSWFYWKPTLTFLKTSWPHNFNLHWSKGIRQLSFPFLCNTQAYCDASRRRKQMAKAKERVNVSDLEDTIFPKLQSLWMFICRCGCFYKGQSQRWASRDQPNSFENFFISGTKTSIHSYNLHFLGIYIPANFHFQMTWLSGNTSSGF